MRGSRRERERERERHSLAIFACEGFLFVFCHKVTRKGFHGEMAVVPGSFDRLIVTYRLPSEVSIFGNRAKFSLDPLHRL